MKRLPPSLRRRFRPLFETLEDRAVPALFTSVVELETLSASKGASFNGFQSNSSTGAFVKDLGDINGDGFDDIAISTQHLPGATGEIYVVFGQFGNFGADFALSSLDGTNGFRIIGPANGEIKAIDGAGDFNNDGKRDFIVGAKGVDKAFVVFGKTSYSATMNLGTFGATDGVVINGEDFIGQFGTSVAGVGDFNGDDIDDVLVGDPTAPVGANNFAGKAFVIYGSGTIGSTINVTDLDGTDGFELSGIGEDDHAGDMVTSGDVNGDGLSDLIIGGPGFGLSTNNEASVVFGSSTPFGAQMSLGSLNGTTGFKITGAGYQNFANFGRLAGGGDVNNDGFDDILIGAGGLLGGKAFVVFGHSGAFPTSIDVNSMNSTTGITIDGTNKGSFAEAVSFVDINNDGKADVLIGSPDEDDFLNGDDSFQGYAYLIFGKSNPQSISVDALTSKTGIVFKGFNSFGRAGDSVASAGDLNGDGSLDLLIGMPDESPSTSVPGQAFVFYGKGGPPASNLNAPIVDVTKSGGKSYKFTVKYTDTVGVKTKTIGNNDILVTSTGGFNQVAKFVKVNNTTNGKVRIATYKFTPPAGFWDFRDNDTYTLTLQDGAVLNTLNKPIEGKILGTFDVAIPEQIIAVGKNSKGSNIQVFSADGSLMYTITNPFGVPFTGGTRVAVGDVNADGVPDVVAAMGPDSSNALATEIRIFSGVDGSLIGALPPYGNSYYGGAYVAVGDFDTNNDGVEIVVGPGSQADDNPVRVLDLVGTVLNSFHPYEDLDPLYEGGVRVAIGEIDGAQAGLELVTAMDSATAVSIIRAWNNDFSTQLWEQTPNLKNGGAFLAIGNVDADGDNEVVVGAEGKNKPFVRILDGDTGATETSFLAYAKTFKGGVRVGLLDVNNDGRADVIVGAKSGRQAKVFNVATKKPIDAFNAFEKTFKGGLFVAGG